MRDVDGRYARWLERLGAEVVLVRPDFHVFGTAAETAGADRLVSALAAQLGPHAVRQ